MPVILELFVVKVIAFVMFVLSTGLLFSDRFRNNWLAVGLASFIAIGSSIVMIPPTIDFLTDEICKRIECKRLEAAPVQSPSVEPVVGVSDGPKAGQTFQDCADCPQMVVIPAGTFLMGSPEGEEGRDSDEGPQRRVTIARPFAAGKFEVTRDQFAQFVQATNHQMTGGCFAWTGSEWKRDAARSGRSPGYEQSGSHPVACVSWDDAQAYARWLSLKTGVTYRLPSEAEWEYAARASDTGISPWGTDLTAACARANGADRAFGRAIASVPAERLFPCTDGFAFTAPVGTFAANGFGLRDTLGNVWEWTEDCYQPTLAGVPEDGRVSVSTACNRRVLRGGSWYYDPQILRSAIRDGISPTRRSSNLGFRLARDIPG